MAKKIGAVAADLFGAFHHTRDLEGRQEMRGAQSSKFSHYAYFILDSELGSGAT